MSNDIIPANTKIESIEQFKETMAALEGANFKQFLSPKIIRLHGKKGEWVERKWNVVKKESEESVFQDNADGVFVATPILAKFFAKWKYNEANKTVIHQTREFQLFDGEPVELLKITYGDKTSTESVGTYKSYQDFKAKYAKADELTGKVTSPYDLYVALYAYHWGSNSIIKIKMKGSSRSAWFDFPAQAKDEFGVRSITELQVEFGKRQDTMQDGTPFYAANLKALRTNSPDEMQTIMNATIELDKWMKSFKEGTDDEEPIVPAQSGEIRMEDIPF